MCIKKKYATVFNAIDIKREINSWVVVYRARTGITFSRAWLGVVFVLRDSKSSANNSLPAACRNFVIPFA